MITCVRVRVVVSVLMFSSLLQRELRIKFSVPAGITLLVYYLIELFFFRDLRAGLFFSGMIVVLWYPCNYCYLLFRGLNLL